MPDIRVNRRDFLRGVGATLACQTVMSANANPLGMPIGFQGYDARFLLMKNWDQGWLEMQKMGYQSVDLVSFRGYGYENSPLSNLSGKEIRQKLDSIGMLCEKCQFYFAELHGAFDEKI